MRPSVSRSSPSSAAGLTRLYSSRSAHLHLLLFPSLTHLALIARPSHTSLDARTQALVDRLRALHPKVEIEHSCVEGYDRGQAVHNADLILCWCARFGLLSS